jgi:hypothetical protein
MERWIVIATTGGMIVAGFVATAAQANDGGVCGAMVPCQLEVRRSRAPLPRMAATVPSRFREAKSVTSGVRRALL